MKIALIGYGKMGKAIEEVAAGKGHEVVLKISQSNLDQLTTSNLSKASVAIEFTQPHAAFENIMKCFEANIPVVCGTTGWNDKMEEVKKICIQKNQSFFQSPNFSIGVNLFFAINDLMATFAGRYPEYNDISISETHHTRKKDAPSGTAVAIANDILKSVTRLKRWESYPENKLKTGSHLEDNTILPVYSTRMGEVPGLHEVRYGSEDDTIKLVHEAKGRGGFAKGSVAAAEWLIGKKGVFGMKDLLEL